MPVLSLPWPRVPVDLLEYFPIRVPFPFMRIASILPQSINEPFKASLLSLFKLAWSAKLQIPVLITVVFMACDIRLQLEINIIWEANNRQQGNQIQGQGSRNAGGRLAAREDMRRAALVGAALYQQQRRRLIQEMRAQQERQREATRRRPQNEIPIVAPLALEEDSDLDGSQDSDGLLDSDSDTLTCSRRSTTSEAGMFGSDEVDSSDTDTEGAEENGGNKERQVKKKKKKLKRSRPSSREPINGERADDDTSSEEDGDDDDEDEDDDDEDFGGGSGRNGGGGSSHYGGGGGGGGRDRYGGYDHDSDVDENSNDESGPYSSPLVVEVEIRHRSQFPPTPSEPNTSSFSPITSYKININKPNYFQSIGPVNTTTYKNSYYKSVLELLSPLHLL